MKKHIPNFITSLNLACGAVAIVFTFQGHFEVAFPLMLAAALFDFLDGMAARALKAYSPMGRELDSLADMVSFGVLPSMMLFCLMRTCSFGENPLCFAALLIAVFSGLRLAKFNIDERQHENFLGLPTPACALLCGALCDYVAYAPASLPAIWSAGVVFIPVLSLCLSALLVSELPMFSMKLSAAAFKTRDALFYKRMLFVLEVIVIAVLVAVFGAHWSLSVLLSFALYILKNLLYALLKV